MEAKRAELLFNFLLLPVDILMVILAFVGAYYLRSTSEILPVVYIWPLFEYLKFVFKVIPFWPLIFALEGLYNTRNTRKGLDEFAGIFVGVSAGIMLVVLWIFLSRSLFFSRLVIIYSWLLAITLIFIGRRLIRGLQRYLYRYKIGIRRVAILGDNGISEIVANQIHGDRKLGYLLIGLILTGKSKTHLKDIRRLGSIENLKQIIGKFHLDEIIITDTTIGERQLLRILEICKIKNILLKVIPNLFKVASSNIDFTTFGGVPIIEYKKTSLDGWGRITKRAFDLVFALIVLVITSPINLIIALIIKLDSKGPVLFRQERVGLESNFIFYKFRSMYEGAEKEHNQYIKKYGNMFKLKNDPRMTRFGKFLRKTSLDELPQFINVLKGEMSVVGPRPPMPVEVAKYSDWQKQRLGIKPGITGLWQVSGRSDISFDEWVRLDVFYIENWSPWLDLQIILRTILAIFKKSGAY